MPKGIKPKNYQQFLEGGKKTQFKSGHKINLGKRNALGVKRTEEHKKAISEAKKGIPRSEETRKKLSLAAHKRWSKKCPA